MCGQVKRSENPEQAVEFAIAYAKSFEHDEEARRWGEPLPDSTRRLEFAQEFLWNYTPAVQRGEARILLELRNAENKLDTELDYWRDAMTD